MSKLTELIQEYVKETSGFPVNNEYWQLKFQKAYMLDKKEDKSGSSARLIQRLRLAEKAAEDINAVMWEGAMINEMRVTKVDATKIMNILKEWCEKEESIE